MGLETVYWVQGTVSSSVFLEYSIHGKIMEEKMKDMIKEEFTWQARSLRDHVKQQ